MLSVRNCNARIATLRPLRPPSKTPLIRPFTQNSQLLLLASRHAQPRPQLPYLYHQLPVCRQTLLGPNQQIARLFSNETKRYVKQQVWLATKWTVIIWTFAALSYIVYAGIVMERTERRSPTPPEWSWRSRYVLRGARELMDEDKMASIGRAVDWARVSSFFETALQRCEDPKFEGKGLIEVGKDGEEILIPGVGKAGYDISAKSWPWRSAYFEAIMGCALAAEHLDGKVLDTTNHVVYEKEFVIGPSNPDPRPKTHWMSRSPKEEDVTEACAPPETFYMKVLTGRGFTTKQKMDAASAYANWLDFKGLPDSAEEMYRWAVDIARSALPIDVDPNDIIDHQTNVIKTGEASREITPNLLQAATDMAVHHARNNDVSAALPILLSILRARRTAPVSPFPPPTSVPAHGGSDIGSMISSLLHGSRFPPPPPSGDHPLIRSSELPTCEDSELMLYIGEILYATSPTPDEGLGWTRQAVTIADANLAMSLPPISPGADEMSERKKCKECLATGVRNWDSMLTRLMEKETGSAARSRGGWIGWARGGKAEERLDELQDDRKRLDVLIQRVMQQGIDEQIYGSG